MNGRRTRASRSSKIRVFRRRGPCECKTSLGVDLCCTGCFRGLDLAIERRRSNAESIIDFQRSVGGALPLNITTWIITENPARSDLSCFVLLLSFVPANHSLFAQMRCFLVVPWNKNYQIAICIPPKFLFHNIYSTEQEHVATS